MLQKQILILILLANFSSLLSLPSPRSKISEELKALRLSNQRLQTENQRLSTEKEQATKNVNEFQVKINELEKKLSQAQSQGGSVLQTQIHTLIKEKERLKTENQNLNTKYEYYKNQLVTIITLVNFSTSKKIKKGQIYRKAIKQQEIEKQIKNVVRGMENYKKQLLESITIDPINILNRLNETVLQGYFFNYPEYYNLLNLEKKERENKISALAKFFANKFKTKKPVEQLTEEELRKQVKQYQEEHQKEKRKLEDIVTRLRSGIIKGSEATKEIVEEVLEPYYGAPGILKSN